MNSEHWAFTIVSENKKWTIYREWGKRYPSDNNVRLSSPSGEEYVVLFFAHTSSKGAREYFDVPWDGEGTHKYIDLDAR